MAVIAAMQWAVSAQTLVHDYSFSAPAGGIYGGGLTTNVADSINPDGSWDGICMTSGTNAIPTAGNFDGSGILTLQQANQDYVQLPVGVLSNYTAVTIDLWATFGTLPTACFVYGFGGTDPTVLSGGQASGYDCIFCQPYDGRIAISAQDPSWYGEEGAGGAGNLSGKTVHVTSVYNPPAGYLELYTNGVLVSRNTSVTVQMSQVTNLCNYIARSLYNADSYMDVNMDEFRIWDGALNPLQVAGCDANGPNNPSTGYGTVTNVQLSLAAYQLPQGSHEPATVTAQASGLPPTPVDITTLATYTTSNTNILVATNNLIYAVGQGFANVIASYGGLYATQAVAVVAAGPPLLMHRYSFTTDTSDSVGGVAWAGTLNGATAVSGGQLVVPNTNNTAPAPDYLQLPAGILTNSVDGIGTNFNDPAVTMDAWVTLPSSQYTWANLFDFGVRNGAGQDAYSVSLCVHAGNPNLNTVAAISDSDNANAHRQNLAVPTVLDGRTNIHVTVVFNPPAGYAAIYTNGILMGKNTAITISMAGVQGIRNIIGADNWPDPGLRGSVDEFRIFDGALTSQDVAISDGAGPDSIPAAVTNGPGALQSVTLQVPGTLETPLAGSIKLLANYANLTGFDLIGNSIFPPTGLTISSSDPNVAYIGADNRLHANYPGQTTVTVVYQGVTNSATVTVTQPAATPSLVHRYSFDDANGSTTAADTVGGSTWNGMVMTNDFSTNAGYVAPGNFTDTQLQLAASNLNFVQLPGGILSNYTAVTIEAWASFGTLPGNCFFFGFGATETNGAGYRYIFCQPRNGAISITRSNPGWNPDQPAGGGGNWSGRTNLHVVAIFNPPAGYEVLYTNGVQAAINTAINVQMNEISNVLSYIARSLYTGDSYFDVSLDEFRIYSGALSPAEIAASQMLGPDQVLTTNVSLSASPSGGNVVFSWPAAAAGFTLQSRSSLTPGAWTTVTPAATLVGSHWQATIPNSGGTQFFRLVR